MRALAARPAAPRLAGLRRVVPCGLAVAVGVAAMLAPAAAQTTRVFDASTKQWIEFDPRKMTGGTRAVGGIDPRFERKIVPFRTSEKPGTIIIDTDKKYLFFVLPNFQAVRYGVGVGREGFGWSGQVRVGRKAEWPTWTPPAEMVARDPKAAKWAGGMPGGPENPLGARAFYLYEGNRDTIYRIHGTNEPWSIGHNVSSGCIRMLNEDVTDLYERAPVNTPVFVLQQGAALF